MSTVISLIFFASVSVHSQELEQLIISEKTNTKKVLELVRFEKPEQSENDDPEFSPKADSFDYFTLKNYRTDETEKEFYKFFKKKEFREIPGFEEEIKEFPVETPAKDTYSGNQNGSPEKFHWKPAIIESLYFLGIQHGFRMIQKKTTDELGGPFFRDWGKSVKNLNNWRDGDSFATNYIAHPMQGAVTGRIFINNSDRSKKLEFSKSKQYWESRFKAMLWSAVWSTQFELGPLSEASIGNVGLYDRVGPNRMGWVDLIVTPTAGTGVLIGEDIIDKYILKNWLERGSSRTRIKIYRTFFTPFQSFSNLLRGKALWRRDNR